jgi:hypothetical protein
METIKRKTVAVQEEQGNRKEYEAKIEFSTGSNFTRRERKEEVILFNKHDKKPSCIVKNVFIEKTIYY